MNKVGIIIPCRGNPDLTISAIKSILKTKYTNFKIYIANNDADNEDRKILLDWIKENLNNKIVKYIQYDWYRFGKLNNNVVKNYLDADITHILFCNNDIEIIDGNDPIFEMMKEFENGEDNWGTIGCKLLFKNDTIQHAGQIIQIRDTFEDLYVSHFGFKDPREYHSFRQITNGNTCGFCMIERKLFEDIGMFNEKYIECFEDVELNLQCILHNRKNYYLGDVEVYHYESVTRNKNKDKHANMVKDYNENLLPFVKKNFKKLKELL